MTESVSADCRVTIYEILLQLMVKEEDLVVRLSAAHSLKMAIDDWDFDIAILLPYLGSAMELMMTLINEVEESDTVMKLIADLNTVMDRAGAHVSLIGAVKANYHRLIVFFFLGFSFCAENRRSPHSALGPCAE